MDSRKDAEAFDFVVIGGGAGGYVAAIRASQLGASVVVVEREIMGGVCRNWGCIPTKALLKTAEVRHTVENLSKYGMSLEGSIGVDMAKGKAIAVGEPDGMVKTIFDAESGALIGAHLVGPEVTEMIQGFAIAMKLETTEKELMETIFSHPTLSEAMRESVLDAYERVIHQ